MEKGNGSGMAKKVEVKEMRYLWYITQKNGRAEKHITERLRRATIAMKQMWNIREKMFKEDYKRRIKMFNALVESVALYGKNIWGWANDGRMDGIKRKYIKWKLELNRKIPTYILV